MKMKMKMKKYAQTRNPNAPKPGKSNPENVPTFANRASRDQRKKRSLDRHQVFTAPKQPLALLQRKREPRNQNKYIKNTKNKGEAKLTPRPTPAEVNDVKSYKHSLLPSYPVKC